MRWAVSLAIRTFYRFRVSGGSVPATGPVLIVANHPNMAADPAAVVTVANRWVHFIGKAPLFTTPVLGGVLRALGAIPVHRRSEAPEGTANVEAFDAVARELRHGSVVAIFPEGISHGEPSLAPLRTGAARMILQACREGVHPVVLPVGLTYADKARFRSRAMAIIGERVQVPEPPAPDDEVAWVRDLTGVLERRLARITLNLESWSDLPVVEMAERIHASVFDRDREPGERIGRTAFVASVLERMRREGDPRADVLVGRIRDFDVVMSELNLAPASLEIGTDAGDALRWMVTRAVPLVVAGLIAVVARIVFLPPYVAVAILARGASTISKATTKILAGAVLYPIWIAVASTWIGSAAGVSGWIWSTILLVLAFASLASASWVGRHSRAVHRYFVLRGGGGLRARLIDERDALAEQLEKLRNDQTRSG